MDPLTRQTLSDAFALSDETARDFEQWQNKLKQRSSPDDVVYKTHYPQQPVQQMDAETERKWNEWADDRILRMFEPGAILDEAIGEALATIREQLRREFSEQLGQLRADLTLQTGIQRAQIVEIKKGKADAA